MKYIDRILQPGEQIVYSSKIHWIIYLSGTLILLVALISFVISIVAKEASALLMLLSLACVILGLALLFQAWLRRWTTEIDVTNRRIVFKRGLIRRYTIEMNMDKVESVDVTQSILGRLFDYGDIVIRGTGVGLEPLHDIDSPLQFRNNVIAR